MSTGVILLSYGLAGVLLDRTGGFYDRTVPIFALGLMAAVAAMLRDPRPAGAVIFRRLGAGVYVVFTALIVLNHSIHLSDSGALTAMNAVTRTALAIGAPLALLLVPAGLPPRGRRAFRWLAAASVGLLVAWQILIPFMSPHPGVDVLSSNTAATNYFLRGINPYVVQYPDIYNGKYQYEPGFLYFPGALFLYAPMRLFGGDIRLVHAFANIVSAAAVAAVAMQQRMAERTVWLMTLLWLALPITGFVIEQAWIDILLVPCVFWAIWAIGRRDWILTGVLCGIALALKQYAGIAVAPLLLLILRQAGWRAAAQAAAIAAGIAAALILPMALLDWTAFVHSTIAGHLDAPVRRDAYNVTIYLYRQYHWLLSPGARLTLAAIGGLGGTAWLALKPQPDRRDALAAMSLILAASTLFGKWAFCNYYYWLASFMLLYIVMSVRTDDASLLH